ncbi:MAG TPA: MFS transporter [Nostocaceae cyanobacterium]|nr:MFS transporter [Nostocaceae cyanobacterium]
MEKAGNNRVSLGLLGAAAFMVIADARVIDPLLHIIAEEFDIGVGGAAIIISAYTIPYGLFQLFYGPLGDRIGRLKVITFALTAFAVGTTLCAFVSNIVILTLLRFLTGMFAAGIIPVTLAYIGDNFPYAERQTAIGKYLSALVLGQVLSTSLGGIFGQYISWREIFLVLGGMSLIIAFPMWQKSRSHKTKPHQQTGAWFKFRPYYELLTQQTARTVMIGVLIEGSCALGAYSYTGAFLRDRFNIPYLTIGFMLGGFGLGGFVYSRCVKWLVQRLGENGLIGVGGCLMFIGYITVAFLPHWTVFIPISMLMGLAYYMLHGTLQTRATELSPESRGVAVSLFAFNFFIGQGCGAAVFGRIVDNFGYTPCFIIAGVTLAVLSIWLVKQTPQLKTE